ncbi:MAG: hypothetical protein SH821_17840 [Phototrophicales bacterium]|nr:hypothetical protein [Phototrophicales bacterium]
MSDTNWKNVFEPVVLDILRSDVFNLKQAHHFGRPFVTAYQLAVAVEQIIPDICQQLQFVIGEKTANGKINLPQYLANQLSREIKENAHYEVEGTWLCGTSLVSLTYSHDPEVSEAAPNWEYGAYSLYRVPK